jgi:hypothetical protein
MAENRAKIMSGLGALLLALVIAGFTHSMDKANWATQHAVERTEYRQLQAEKVFDSVTTLISRVMAMADATNVYHQYDSQQMKDSLGKVLLARLMDFEVALPAARAKIKLYFSDSTYRKFEGSFPLMQGSYVETLQNIKPRAPQHLKATAALLKHMNELAAMMASELANGISSKK